MTLIAFAAHADRAEIITDTLTYTHTATRMGHTSKLLPLPHLDAAIVAQGSTGFERRWHMQALYLAQHAADFDEFAREAPAHLAHVWSELGIDLDAENIAHGRSATVTPSVVFLVGYSPQRQRFVAYGFASDHGFAPTKLDGLYAMPSPLDRRPGDLELHRLRGHLPAVLGDQADRAVAALGRLPIQPAPRRPEEWVDLAKAVRRDRAMADLYSGLKTYVGGDVMLTALRRGESTTRRIHTFNDSGSDFARMMAGSLHPMSQASACECDSGRRFVDCCLAAIADEPCPCQSGKVFAACCSINADMSATAVA
ncbi:SEC-C domain-containing protein [Blastococcus sp. MG754426]|uniref:SEC-C metal-binding domain-containing protein n=1 Tax=unclassified Blastococcus TaxID=2619396 RepID=UPI001EF09A0E|nr:MULTISPECIES: SEC-C metal-binding domain-containing protein [unclassified Blastococcus]MCF6507372.1 SEC-C domain-containing protein [Blastococcus sp. MG754426]MCF6511444.1 SEC-C domain-containing protein [Blastococcus sp. MG754427]